MIDHQKYMLEARIAAQHSPCKRRKVGCVLVPKIGPAIIEYNSPMHTCVYCNRQTYASGEGLELCRAIHAEVACIARAAFSGIETRNAILYTSSIIPCKNCMLALIWAGVHMICVADMQDYDDYGRRMAADADIFIQEVRRDAKEIISGKV